MRSKKEMAELRRFFRGNSFQTIPVDEPIGYAAAGLIEYQIDRRVRRRRILAADEHR